MTTLPPLDQINLSEMDFWELGQDDRAEVFRQFRAADPFPFFAEPENPLGPNGPGYYVLTRHRDVVAASKNPQLFYSGKGATGPLDQSPEVNDFFGSMINMDDPRHKRLGVSCRPGSLPDSSSGRWMPSSGPGSSSRPTSARRANSTSLPIMRHRSRSGSSAT